MSSNRLSLNEIFGSSCAKYVNSVDRLHTMKLLINHIVIYSKLFLFEKIILCLMSFLKAYPKGGSGLPRHAAYNPFVVCDSWAAFPRSDLR